MRCPKCGRSQEELDRLSIGQIVEFDPPHRIVQCVECQRKETENA